MVLPSRNGRWAVSAVGLLASAVEPGPVRITIVPAICGGRPTIRGMRIRVVDVLEMLADGMTPAEILADFPYLEAADIRACLNFAAAQANGTWHPSPQVA